MRRNFVSYARIIININKKLQKDRETLIPTSHCAACEFEKENEIFLENVKYFLYFEVVVQTIYDLVFASEKDD